jgi:hypothetical protein
MHCLRKDVILHFVDSFMTLSHSLVDSMICSCGVLGIMDEYSFVVFKLPRDKTYIGDITESRHSKSSTEVSSSCSGFSSDCPTELASIEREAL